MNPQRHFRFINFLFLVLAAFLPVYGQEARLSGFDDYVNQALREWEVPVKSLTLIQGSAPNLVLLPKQ